MRENDTLLVLNVADYSYNSAFGIRINAVYPVSDIVSIGLVGTFSSGQSFNIGVESSVPFNVYRSGSVRLYEIGVKLCSSNDLGRSDRLQFNAYIIPSAVFGGLITTEVNQANVQSKLAYEEKLDVGISLETALGLAFKINSRTAVIGNIGYGLVNVHNKSRTVTTFIRGGVNELPNEPKSRIIAVARDPYTFTTGGPSGGGEFITEIPKVIVPMNYLMGSVTFSYSLK